MLSNEMDILQVEMPSPDAHYVQQDHDLPEQHSVQVDASSELLLSFKNDDDTDRHFVHWVRCNILCNVQ
jgi:hypothetical protein